MHDEMRKLLIEPAPKTRTNSSEILDQKINHAPNQYQRKSQINKDPPADPPSQMGFLQTMAHDGLIFFALVVSIKHSQILST
jgi:hypothetical protein